MTCVKQELLDVLTDKAPIKCALLYTENGWGEPCTEYVLPVNHTPEQLEAFLDRLDFNYDSGYGGQVLFGTIWLTDNTWFDRGEYDGSEWWQYNMLPAIPEECLPVSVKSPAVA